MRLGPIRVARVADEDRGTGFMRGGGEMGARMRALDWSRTPLGDPERWPRSLKTAVRIMLTSRQPKFVWWGAELTNLYNDPYSAILGARHPHALARPASEVWSEIWDQVGARAQHVLDTDEGTFDESLPLVIERNGYAEDAYFTFSYSPIPGEDGRPGGIICACIEDTRRIVGEHQIALLQLLAHRTAEARTAAEACERAATCIDEHRRLLPFALLYLLDSAGGASLAGCAGVARGSFVAPTTLGPTDGPWPVAQALMRSKCVQIVDLRRHGVDVQATVAADGGTAGVRYALQVPIVPPGRQEPVAVLVAGLNPHRVFDDAYRHFTALVSGQIAAAIFNAQAYEAELRRAEALAQINRAKTEFFSNVSHEFRTPLTLMLGPIEALAQLSDRQLPEVLRGDIAIARRNGLRLLKLVNTLLDFARLEGGRASARYVPVDLAAETREIASEFVAIARRSGLSLEIRCDEPMPDVYVDRDMWEKIVLNLLSNAIKFTLHGGVRLSLSTAGGRAQLQVADTGIGIPSEELARIFDRFHRVEDRYGRSFEGSGIGLALVRELVDAHGGTVEVESVEGQGSTFTVLLPYGSSHLPAAFVVQGPESAQRNLRLRTAFLQEAAQWLQDPEPTGSAAPLHAGATDGRATIVFADDNADMRSYISRLMAGHHVIAVRDGEEALAVVRERPVDLVITDALMPRLDGDGLLSALRRDPATATLPVIMVSAHAGEEARIEGLRSGADDYLTKPFSARELQARVEAQLAMSRLRDLSRRREHALRADAQILVELAQEIDAELDLERLAQKVIDAGVRLTDASAGAFFYAAGYESGTAGLRCAASGASRAAFARQGFPRDQPLFDATFPRGVIVRHDDLAADRQDAQGGAFEIDDGQPVRSYLAVPVRGRSKRMLGALVFCDARTGVFGERAERLATGIAAQAAVAIDNAHAYQDATRAIQHGIRSERAYRNSERRYRELIDAMPVAVFTCDADGVLTLCNDAAARLWGRPPRLGVDHWWDGCRLLTPVTGEPVPASEDPVAVALRERRPLHGVEVVVARPDGTRSHLLAYPRPLYDDDGAVSGAISILVDVTELKKVEAELRESDERKTEFLAILAHELRNPLAPIRNGMEVLRLAPRDSPVAAQAQALIERQIDNMVRLVDDLLDLSRITRGMIELRRAQLDVRDAVAGAIEACRTLIDDAGHELVADMPDVPVHVVADATRLEQVFINLLGNAVRYTPRGGRIRIRVVAGEDQVAVHVVDNGIGIPQGMHARIFDMFTQGDRSLERSAGGLGIGLTLVQRIVSMHGGSVQVISEGQGRGSEFVVCLPRTAAEIVGQVPERAGAPGVGSACRILIVDDHADAATSMALMLEMHGSEVRVAGNGIDAIALAQEFRPNVILMDIGMPLLNGYDACRRIRGLDGGGDIVMVAVTGWGQPDDKLRSSDAGFDHHWVKPVSMQQIERLLRERARTKQSPADAGARS